MAAWALVDSPAWAHGDGGQGAGFAAGLLHPIFGLDHVVAMVAVGLWGAVLGPPALWLLPVAFPIVVAIAVLSAVLPLPLAPPQPRWLAIGLRVAGSWIAAAGLMMLAWLARHPQ